MASSMTSKRLWVICSLAASLLLTSPTSTQTPPDEEPSEEDAEKCEEGDLDCLSKQVDAMNSDLDSILKRIKAAKDQKRKERKPE